MDMGDFRGLLTALLLVLFVGVWISSWSRRRTADFRAAERLPLDDDELPREAASKHKGTGHE